MVKRYLRTMLALLLCCAMLASNLGFSEELTELAADAAAQAELAPEEAAVEEAAEPEAAPAAEESAPADEAEEAPTEEPAEAPEQATEPEADAAPEEGEAAEPEAPEQDVAPAPDGEMGGGSQPELTPEEEHPVILEPAPEESIEGEEFAADGCEHQWEYDPDTHVATCQICSEKCYHENAVPEGDPWLDDDESPSNVIIKVGDPDVDLRPDPDWHYVKGPGWQPVHCEVCDVRYDEHRDEVVVTSEHVWDENGLKCVDCNYAYEGCTHPHKEEEYGHVGRIPFDCVEPDDEHYPQDLGNGQHRAWGVDGTYTYCPDCGLQWNQNPDGEDHWITEPHEFNGEANENGEYVCWICGKVNDCEHPGAEFLGEEFRPREFNPADGDTRDEYGHRVKGELIKNWHCPVCDGYYQTSEEWIDEGNGHDWNSDQPGRVCRICGYVNPCDHEGTTELQEWEETDWEREGGWKIRSDANGCSVWTQRCQQYYCQKCDAWWGWEVVEDGIKREYQPHEWDENDPNDCIWCDYENPCNHARAEKEDEEGWYDPTDDGRSFDESIGTRDAEGHHGIPAIHNFWWNCPDCGAHYMTREEEDSVDAGHDWDDDNTCRICGYENPCDHSNFRTEEWEEPDWDRENPVIVSNETSHQVWARTVSEKECRDCGYRFDWKIVRDGYKVTGEHSYYYDEEEDVIWCGMCHRVSECDHPDAEIWDAWFEVDSNAPGNVIDGDHHHVTGTLYRRMYCPACDTDYIEREENYVEDGDHAWDWSFDGHDPAISWCAICHKENPCKHEHWHEFDDQYEPDPAYGDDYLIDSNDEGHTYHAIYLTSKQCDDCGSVFDRVEHPVEENGGVITEEHQWDYEDPNHCWVCGWENSCDHPDEECVTNWENLYPNEDTHVDWCTEYEHRVSNMTWEAKIHCNKCGADFHVETEEYVHEGEHEWDDDGKTCRWCGYENTCEHPVGVIFPEEWYELENGDEQAVNNGDTHTGMFVKYAGTHCEQCDAHFEVHVVEGPEEMELPHQWSYDDEGRTCDFCDAENNCQHKNTTENWVDVDDVDWDAAKIIEQTPEGHVMNITCRAELYCEDCGAAFQVEYDNYTLEEEHDWDAPNATPVCWKCGYVPKCEHREDRVIYSEWWELDDSRTDCIVSTSDEGHTGYMRKIGMYECLDCGANWGWTILEQRDKPELAPHEWEEDGQTCWVCGYSNPCKHENREYFDDDYWFETTDETKVESADENGHRVSHLIRYIRYHCLDCDEVYVERDEDFEAEGEHEWNGEDGNSCWICEYANPCNHKGTTEAAEPWVEPDDDYPNGGVVSANANNHTYYARRVQDFHCTNCGATFGWEVLENGFTVTEPHDWDMWDEARTCNICGEENTCKHPHATLEGEWYEPYEYTDQPDSVTNHNWGQDESHKVKATLCQDWYCEDCDSWYRIDTENVDVERDHEWNWDSEEGVSRCWMCGKENECEHKHSHADEWWDFDGEEDLVNCDENGHTAWFWHCTGVWCDDCQSRINIDPDDVERVKAWREHEWNEDDECRTCWVCGWENPCDHEDTLELVDILELHLNENTSRNEITAEGHEVYCDARVRMHCTNCDAEFETEWEDERFIGEHEWVFNPQGEAVCKFCDYKNPCEHENFEVNCWVDPDWDSIESDANGHTYSAVKVTQKICDDCGMELEWNEEPLGETVTEVHVYNAEDDDGGAHCLICDWENPCTKHTPTGGYTWTQFIRVGTSSAAGHIVVLAKAHELVCANCGAHMGDEMIEGTEEELFVEHVYDGETPEDCAECLECGWKNPCTHEKHHTVTGQEPIAGAFVSRSATGHVMLGYSYSYEQCDYCTATWNSQTEMGIQLEEQPHRWDSVNGEYCIDCDYHNTCKHSGAKQTQDKLDPIYIQDLGTSDEHAYIQQTRKFKQCDSCGAKYDVAYEMEGPTFEAHEFGSGTVCSKCGFDKSKDAALTGIHFDTTAIALGVSEKYTPVLVREPANSASAITYKSGNAQVFTVNERTGEITAIGVGEAELTATGNGKTASVSVQVMPLATSIRLDDEELTLPVGKSVELYAHLLPSGSMSDIYWSNSDEGVVRYDNGKLTALRVGDATITATIRGGASAECVVHVLNAPSKGNMSIELEKYTIGVGETIDAWVNYRDAWGDYEITSSNTSVVSVIALNGEFELQGKAAGTANITAKAYNGVQVSVELTVLGAPDKITFDNKPSKMGVGEYLTLNARLSRKDGKECGGSVTYSSSKPAVVSVNAETGELHALKAGSAKITAKCGKLSKSLTISVKKAATSIALNQTSISLGVGDTQIPTLKATLKPSGAAANVSWSSSNEDVVDVDEATGKITIVDSGSALITASIYEGRITADCRVTVCNKPTPETMTLLAPQSMVKGTKAEVSVRFSGGTGGSFELSSDRPSVLKVDNKTNTIRALKKGQATLTATAYNNSKVSVLVTVTPAPTAVKNVPKSQTMILDDMYKITPTIAPAEAVDVLTATSDNENVAHVYPDPDDAGVFCVEARATGKATITFTTSNKKKAKCKITVKSRPEEILGLLDLVDEKALVYSATKKYTTTQKLKATLSPADSAGEVKYESDNPSVATVENGTVVPKGLGHTTIHAFVEDGDGNPVCETWFEVAVREAPTTANTRLEPEDDREPVNGKIQIRVGTTLSTKITYIGSAGAVKANSYKSAKPKIAAVNKKTGVITAKKVGSTTISVKLYNGVTISLEIEVIP